MGWPTSSSAGSAVAVALAALCAACGGDAAAQPDEPVVALVRGEPVRAPVPPDLDRERYRAFARERVYQHEMLAVARERGIALTEDERTAALARAPSRASVAPLLKRQRLSYSEFLERELDVALIQKVERTAVFERIEVDRDALRAEYAASAPLQGPRFYVRATKSTRRCDSPVVAGAPPSVALHFAPGGRLTHASAAVPFSPDDIAALGAWATSDPTAPPPVCAAGVQWDATLTGVAPPGPLSFDQVADELTARARFDLERRAFDTWVQRTLDRAAPTILPLPPST